MAKTESPRQQMLRLTKGGQWVALRGVNGAGRPHVDGYETEAEAIETANHWLEQSGRWAKVYSPRVLYTGPENVSGLYAIRELERDGIRRPTQDQVVGFVKIDDSEAIQDEFPRTVYRASVEVEGDRFEAIIVGTGRVVLEVPLWQVSPSFDQEDWGTLMDQVLDMIPTGGDLARATHIAIYAAACAFRGEGVDFATLARQVEREYNAGGV